MVSLFLMGRARELSVSIETYIYQLFLQHLSKVLSLGAVEITPIMKYVEMNRDQNFARMP